MNLFNRHKERARGKDINKIRNRFVIEMISNSGSDAFASMTQSSANEFGHGLSRAQFLSTEELKKRVQKFKKDPMSVGYLVEYMHRTKVDPEILDKYKDVDFKSYFDYLKTSGRNFQKEENKYFVANLAAVGINFGLGYILNKSLKSESSRFSDKTKSFLNFVKNKDNLTTDIEFIKNPIGSYFDSSKNLVRTGNELGVAAHELGHAKNYDVKLRRYGKPLGNALNTVSYATLSDMGALGQLFSKILGPISHVPVVGLAAIPLAHREVTSAIKGHDTTSTRYRAGTFIENNPVLVGTAAVTPKLYEEASASIRGLKNIGKYNKSIRAALKEAPKLIMAFGTYGSAAAIPVAGMYLLNKATAQKTELKKYTDDLFGKS